SGHGSDNGELLLVSDSGVVKALQPQILKTLFASLKDNLQVVIINACYSQLQAKAINETIDFVIGMNAQVGDKAAIAFAASFYRALGFGRTIQEAFQQGKIAIMFENIAEESTPILLIRNGVSDKALNFATGSFTKADSQRRLRLTVHIGVFNY